MKNVALTATLSFCIFASGTGALEAESGIPDAVTRAAAFNAISMGGVVVEERHVTLSVSAGPMHYSEQNDAVVMLQDGAYRHVRYLRIIKNGKPLSHDDLAKRESDNNASLASGEGYFKQPFDARFVHEYQYAEQSCADCAPRERLIAFRSAMRDDQHGDGTMRIDASTGRVLNVTYAPYVLPEHAQSGTTVETFGEAAPGIWTAIAIDRSYSGRVAIFKGGGQMNERIDRVQRFGNPVAGLQYVQRAELR